MLTYTLRADGRILIASSGIGFDGGKFAGIKRRSVNATWKPVWGKRAVVPDRFNEVSLDMTTYRVLARAYDYEVYVNMLAGPLDMNNGLADLMQAGRVDEPSPVPSTLAGEAARTLIVFSGATIIPDIPENYRKHPELLAFIAAQQQPWRESRTLDGAIGEHIVMARQAADGTWLVGAATGEDPRELDVHLAFLGPGSYQAVVIEDGDTADYRTFKESCKVSRRSVSRTDTIRVRLAPGGGACVLLQDARQAPVAPVAAKPPQSSSPHTRSP